MKVARHCRPLPATVRPAIVALCACAGAGGMSEEESTLNLQALQDEVKRLGVQTPWRLTFSYGRALQSATLKVSHLVNTSSGGQH